MNKIERRAKLLDAGLEVISKMGLEGLTHRAVDKMSGLPQGSTSYYYSKKSDLVFAVANHLAELLEKDCDDLQVGFAERVAKHGIDNAIEYVANEMVTYTESTKTLFLARIELTMASARREDLKGIGDKLTAAARRPIEFFLKLSAQVKDDETIETCAGLIDGISLMYATGQGPKPSAQQVAAVFKSIL